MEIEVLCKGVEKLIIRLVGSQLLRKITEQTDSVYTLNVVEDKRLKQMTNWFSSGIRARQFALH